MARQPARSRGNHERWTRSSNAGYMPAAARDALGAMERMASTGFNYGRLTSKGILWYFPTPKLGLFYLDDGRTLIVVDVVDARRLRRLP